MTVTMTNGEPDMRSTGTICRRARRSRGRAGAGFTLLEMMLVVVIIGLLASVAVWNIANQGKKARTGTTKSSLSTISSILTAYHTDNGSYPPTLNALVTAYMEKMPRDAWKHDFVYFPASQEVGRAYTLFSMGQDGQPGTADDINFWTMEDTN